MSEAGDSVQARVFRPKLLPVRGGAVCDVEQVRAWLKLAKPGDRLIYARHTWLPSRAASETVALLQDLFDAGQLMFFQSTLPDEPGVPRRQEYLAIRKAETRRPALPFTARTAKPVAGSSARERASALFGKAAR
jgi:hypothetical protein